MLADFQQFIGDKLNTVALVVGLYFVARIAWRSSWIKFFRTDDANVGKTNA